MDDDENRKTDGETLKLKLKLKQVLTKLKASMLKNKEYQKEIEEFKAAKERASNGVSPGILSEYLALKYGPRVVYMDFGDFLASVYIVYRTPPLAHA